MCYKSTHITSTVPLIIMVNGKRNLEETIARRKAAARMDPPRKKEEQRSPLIEDVESSQKLLDEIKADIKYIRKRVAEMEKLLVQLRHILKVDKHDDSRRENEEGEDGGSWTS
ncbi:hypothetical protein F4811DRAFT_558226 [Daldinia bambusicola]|nr:hypothetical protein F4811DRAFT_558226 [Daldinia bambusicola]